MHLAFQLSTLNPIADDFVYLPNRRVAHLLTRFVELSLVFAQQPSCRREREN